MTGQTEYARVKCMKIAICDDEEVFVNQIYNFLWQQPDCSVERFLSPAALLEKYEEGIRYDVVFLDIVMSPINGIDTASKIRSYDKRTLLVFLTAYLEYAPAGYEVNGFRYLLKPITKEALSLTMRDIYMELETSRTLFLKTPECEFLLCPQDIQYLQADNKSTVICYKDDLISFRKGLSELEQQLPASFFFRIHRKYIVNLAHVREFDETRLTLSCGRTLPISRRKGRPFRLALKTYIEGDM